MDWKAVSRDAMSSDVGGFKITSKLLAPQKMEYRLYRGELLQGRLECRNTVVDRTETLAELKAFADRLHREIPAP